jgi:exonuclease III
MKFCGALHTLCDDLKSKGRKVIVVGDLNIAHAAIDNFYANKEVSFEL